MSDVLNTILKDSYTQTMLKQRLNILKSQFLQNFFGSSESTPSAQAQKEIAGKDLNWLNSLPLSFFQNFNKDNVYDLFSQLEKEADQLQLLTLYLTFEPDDYSLMQIGTFVRQKFSNLLLLDIKYDPNLIAGCSIVWKGIYKDYSLRSRIEEKKPQLLESFKKFLK